MSLHSIKHYLLCYLKIYLIRAGAIKSPSLSYLGLDPKDMDVVITPDGLQWQHKKART